MEIMEIVLLIAGGVIFILSFLIPGGKETTSGQSAEQAKAMEQAESGVTQISEVVQSNSAAAQESSATSEELSAQAISLNELVGQFVLRKD